MRGKSILKKAAEIKNFMSKIVKEDQESHWENTKYLDARHVVPQAYALPKIDFIEKFVSLKNKTIIDVGCGNGVFTYHLSQKPVKNIFGLDGTKYMLLNNPCKDVLQGDAARLPYKNNSVDIVFEANLLHHVDEPEDVINEMKRVSRNYLIFIEPNRLNPLMLAFFLLVKAERGGLKSSKKILVNLIAKNNIKILGAGVMGMISQNNTPEAFLPFLKKFDIEFPFGEYIVIIAWKKRNEDG